MRGYINAKSVPSWNTHRSQTYAENTKKYLASFYDSPFERDDEDWIILNKYSPNLSVALLRKQAMLTKCVKCRDTVELVLKTKSFRYKNMTYKHKCWICKGYKSNRPKEYHDVLKRLFQKLVDFNNRGVIVTKMK